MRRGQWHLPHRCNQKTVVDPGQVVLDPAKHYYISVLPGDAMDPGHAMGGAQIVSYERAWQPVNVIVEPGPLPTATVSAFVFEDDFPLNGEHDASGGVDVLAPNEPGLGGFNITIFDLVGMSGDPAGQMTYDEFGQPLSNALAGTIDPATEKTRARFQRIREPDLTAPPARPASRALSSSARSTKRTAPLCLRWPARWLYATCRRASTAWWPTREPTALRAAKSGCRPTLWTAD